MRLQDLRSLTDWKVNELWKQRDKMWPQSEYYISCMIYDRVVYTGLMQHIFM